MPRPRHGPGQAAPHGARFTERHVRVLHAVAESYIRTAHPVPSQHVASQLDVSSATVRNDFGALEEGGLLQQPHTSAGRIPTAEGFRYYASSYLPPRRLPRGEREAIRRELDGVGGDDLFLQASRLAARLSGYAVLVRLPPDDALRVHEVHLSLVSSRRLLAVVVLENGLVRQLGVGIDPMPYEGVIDEAERNLRQLDLSVGDAPRTLRAVATAADEELARTLRAVADAWVGLRSAKLFRAGLGRLLDEPEGEDPSFVRLVVEHVEGEAALPEAPERDIELDLDDRLAMVSASFAFGAGRGALTLVGPSRMRYPHALSIAREFGRALSAGSAQDPVEG
ncbi:MAG TPA: DeoR family transcriptional regulator [Trueperaceae bacterium]|nr:DeoR family transcriptional regulator [Trueperaceae bacterium]